MSSGSFQNLPGPVGFLAVLSSDGVLGVPYDIQDHAGATLGATGSPSEAVAPMALTDTAIRTTKPSRKPVRLFDGGGMYLEVSPTGGKWWRLKDRFAGKENRLSLGVYPAVGLKAARSRREDAGKLLAAGIDPSDNRRAMKVASLDRAASSFEVVAREWFVSGTSVSTPAAQAGATAGSSDPFLPGMANTPRLGLVGTPASSDLHRWLTRLRHGPGGGHLRGDSLHACRTPSCRCRGVLARHLQGAEKFRRRPAVFLLP
jgi:hypothetical protein